jgi:hypothetical protein
MSRRLRVIGRDVLDPVPRVAHQLAVIALLDDLDLDDPVWGQEDLPHLGRKVQNVGGIL